jgi:hypothetical protein
MEAGERMAKITLAEHQRIEDDHKKEFEKAKQRRLQEEAKYPYNIRKNERLAEQAKEKELESARRELAGEVGEGELEVFDWSNIPEERFEYRFNIDEKNSNPDAMANRVIESAKLAAELYILRFKEFNAWYEEKSIDDPEIVDLENGIYLDGQVEIRNSDPEGAPNRFLVGFNTSYGIEDRVKSKAEAVMGIDFGNSEWDKLVGLPSNNVPKEWLVGEKEGQMQIIGSKEQLLLEHGDQVRSFVTEQGYKNVGEVLWLSGINYEEMRLSKLNKELEREWPELVPVSTIPTDRFRFNIELNNDIPHSEVIKKRMEECAPLALECYQAYEQLKSNSQPHDEGYTATIIRTDAENIDLVGEVVVSNSNRPGEERVASARFFTAHRESDDDGYLYVNEVTIDTNPRTWLGSEYSRDGVSRQWLAGNRADGSMEIIGSRRDLYQEFGDEEAAEIARQGYKNISVISVVRPDQIVGPLVAPLKRKPT